MTNVAGMDHEEWGGWQGVDLRDCLLQRGSYIFICFFVEAHVAVANLDKAQGFLRNVGGAMSHLAVSDSTVDCPEQSGPCPGHTFYRITAINAMLAKVLDNALCQLHTFRLRKAIPNSKKISGHLARKK